MQMCDIYYAYGVLPTTQKTWWTNCVAGEEINKDRYSGKLGGTPWLTILRPPNLKTDGIDCGYLVDQEYKGRSIFGWNADTTQKEICACMDE